MKVRVMEGCHGYFNHLRRHENDVFSIPDEPRRVVSQDEARRYPVFGKIADQANSVPLAFSAMWMIPVSRTTAEKTSTAQDQIDKKHDEELSRKMGESIDDETGSASTDEEADVI